MSKKIRLLDTQKIKRNEPMHTTKKNHQITKEETAKRKEIRKYKTLKSIKWQE